MASNMIGIKWGKTKSKNAVQILIKIFSVCVDFYMIISENFQELANNIDFVTFLFYFLFHNSIYDSTNRTCIHMYCTGKSFLIFFFVF